MAQSSKTFRVFVSSTFSDLKAERNALQERVFPRLRALAESHGCRFQAIDLRWGISEEAGLDQQTMKICLGEIYRCQSTSPRPNFIILLGNRYGWRPIPSEIQEDEFTLVLPLIPEKDRHLLYSIDNKGWYRLDENAVPPVYALQPRTGEYVDYKYWEPVEHHLHDLLETAAIQANLPEMNLIKYTTSATEQEIIQGAIQVVDARQDIFCFARELEGLPQDNTAEGFLDLDGDKPNLSAGQNLLDLKGRLKEVLGENYHEYSANWDDGSPSLEHIDQLCDDVYLELELVILREVAKLEQVDLLEKEISAHQAFGLERARHFIGRTDLLKNINNYLLSPNNRPLAVWGPSGSGKSAVIAKAVQETQKKYPQTVILGYFIGATPNSSNGRSLLESLCRQIIRSYSGDETTLPSSYNELIIEFLLCLGLASKERPLVVFLDALDQLSNLNNARNLAWLPYELPPNTKLVVSTLPGECKDALGNFTSIDNQLELKPMPLEDGKTLLAIWLDGVGRILQTEQRADILYKYQHCGLPLYLKLAFEEARNWRSYDGLPMGSDNLPGLAKGISGILRDLFWRLSQESSHGEILVNHSLGYIAAGKNGLSEDEMLDILSEDPEVLKDFRRRSPKSPESSRLPVVVWSRLFFDLEPYLTERNADGTTLLSFYHRQFGEAVTAKYLAGENNPKRHQALAQYFDTQPLYIESAGQKNPNLRKLSEQPYQQAYGNQENELVKTVTDFKFCEAKIEAVGPYPLLEDYSLATLFVMDLTSQRALRAIQAALLLATNVLIQDNSQLTAQILGRLLFSENPEVQRLLNQAVQPKGRPWLRPLTPGLSPPEGSLLLTIEGDNSKIYQNLINISGETYRRMIEIRITSLTTYKEYIICGLSDGTIKIHNLNTGVLLRTLAVHTSQVKSVAATPDGEPLYLGYETLQKTWVAVTVDGKYIISGSYDQTLRVWDFYTGSELFTLTGHQDFITAVAVTPNGKHVLSASSDGTIKFWDLEKRIELRTLRGNDKSVFNFILSNDGRYIISASNEGTIKIWDVEKGILLKSLPGFEDVRGLAITPDDRLLILSTGNFDAHRNAVIVVDLASGTLVRILTGHRWDVNAVTVTPDGQRIISGSEDSTIKIWDIQTGEELGELKSHTGEIKCLSVTSDGQHLVSAAINKTMRGSGDNTIRVWDLRKIPSDADKKGSRILYAGVRPNRCLVDPCFLQKAIRALSQEKSVEIRFLSSVDGRYGVSQESGPDWAYSRDTLTVWDLDKGIPLCRLTGHDYDIIDWDLTVDGDYVVTASWDKTLKVYDYRNGKEIHTLRGHNQRINSLSLTSDGHKVLSAGEDQILMLWNIPKGERIFSLWGHTDEVSAAVFTPDGKHAISISYDHTFRVWDLETRKEQHEISHSYINVEEIILTPDGKQVIIREGDGTLSIGSEDFAIKVWELETGCLIHTLPGHTNLVIDILVTQDGRYIISTSHDHSLRIWDLKNGQTVARFMGEDNLNIQAISPDGKTILAQGEKGQVHFLQLEEFDFGPAIVTARRLQKPSGVFKLRKPQSDLSVTCIQCNAEFDVDDSKLGGEIYCHACGRLLHLNQTTL